jgi:transcriptional regulator with XRE-family HTH domain
VARQTPIPQREKEICERLKQARLSMNLTRIAFARMLGIDSSRLASYEHARVPVKFNLALGCSIVAGVSLAWLATGAEPREAIRIQDGKLREIIGDNELFSQAFDETIKPLYDAESRQPRALARGNLDERMLDEMLSLFGSQTDGNVSGGGLAKILAGYIEDSISTCPPELYQVLYTSVTGALRKFQHGHMEAIEAFAKLEKSPIEIVPPSHNISDMKAQLPDLLARLNKATDQRGLKTALAKFLGISLPRVSEYLSGSVEPGGELTLKLLRWVEQFERK